MVDPCADADEDPPLIPLRIGDDWGVAFLYKDAVGVVIDLGTDVIQGELFVPYNPVPYDLTIANHRVVIVDPATTVSFVLGMEAAITATFAPDTTDPVSALQIIRKTTGGLKRTIAAFPLQVLQARYPNELPEVTVSRTDPLDGSVISFVGPSDLVPSP